MRFAKQTMPWFIAAAWLLVFTLPLQSAPRVPPSGDTVVERLPDGDLASRARRLRATELARDPTNLILALRVARIDIGEGQRRADPRFLGRAEAALAPWIALAQPPPPVLLLRGVLRQSAHDFDAALSDLDTVIADKAADAALKTQAHLTRAVVHQVRGDYDLATADCAAAAAMVPRLAALACLAGSASLTGRARATMAALERFALAGSDQDDRSSRVWALTVLGEIAGRLDDTTLADRAFLAARGLAPDDTYLLAAHADLMLDTGRAAEVISLLTSRARVDPLLLRLIEAHRQQGTADPVLESDLALRFETSRRRGDATHQREEARFMLHVRDDTPAALRLAEANWRVQREPADASILLEAAAAGHVPDRAAPVVAWMDKNHVEDRGLQAGIARLRDGQP